MISKYFLPSAPKRARTSTEREEEVEEDDRMVVMPDDDAASSEDEKDPPSSPPRKFQQQQQQLSAYELERAAAIARNRLMLASVVRDAALAPPKPAVSPSRTPHRVKRERSFAAKPSPRPGGYHLRSHGAAVIESTDASNTDAAAAAAAVAAVAEEPSIFDVQTYSCRAQATCKAPDSSSSQDEECETIALPDGGWPRPHDSRLAGFELTGHTLRESSLAKIYGMCFGAGGRLLAAGGQLGRVAVFGVSERALTTTAEYAWKGHSGWVSSMQFVVDSRGDDDGGGGSGRGQLLLTAGNDEAVVLWRLQRPAPVAESVVKLNAGIFMADHHGGNVVCALKNGSAVLLSLTESALAQDSVFENLHAGVIKAARFRDPFVFATTGNDRAVRVCDSRAHNGVQAELNNAHDLAANSVDWSQDPNVLASASFDRTIAVIDIRKPCVVHRLSGHCRQATNRHIHRALFAGGGEAVLSAGDGNPLLSLYSARDGSCISRGNLGFMATTFASLNAESSLLAAANSRGVVLLRPLWSSSSSSSSQQQHQ